MKKTNKRALKTTISKDKVIYEYKNTLKIRKPVPPCGGVMKNKMDKKSYKRPKITINNYEDIT